MLGQMVNVTMCGRCRGAGQIVERPCPVCRGEGRTELKRTLRVTIPPGIDDGHQIRLSGEGEAGPRGGVAGNLYVVTHVAAAPAACKRQDTELYYELAVSISQAALGARVPVPTPDGEELVEVKAGTQPGAEIRLRGRGVPHLRRPGVRGDLHVMVDVRVPTRLSPRQREPAGGVRDGVRRARRRAGRCRPGHAASRAAAGASAASPTGSRTRSAERHRAIGLSPSGPPAGPSVRTAGLAAGTWLELSVEADQEAVEAVSEILSRVAPGGVSVEVPFTLVERGPRGDPGGGSARRRCAPTSRRSTRPPRGRPSTR